MNEITIRELVDRSHSLAKSKGWHELWPDGATKSHVVNVPEKLALIHSEVSEALEEYRKHGVRMRCGHCNGTTTRASTDSPDQVPCECGRGFLEVYTYDGGPKPEGFVVELADAVIRIADLCGALGLDLAGAIETKHRFNETRSFRHGGKRA
jgi:hypothetical protein